tara:strand:+ start:173 stop:574 length:402 start_codon:yes stop_codon:yes gene_type:complete
MDLNKYRNCINNLINWEWNTLKELKRKRRRNILLRGSFAIFSLVSILLCIFSPPFILNRLLRAIGFDYFVVDWIRIISFFIWLWFISPIDKLSKKERYEKNKRKVDLVKAIEKARETYDKNLNKTNSAATNKK